MLNVNNLSKVLIVHKRLINIADISFEISVVAPDEKWADDRIENGVSEIKRILAMLSTTNKNSPVSAINDNAGVRPVFVGQELFNLVNRSLKISDLTQGAFDITYNSTDHDLWNSNRSITALPDIETAKQSVRLVDYRNVLLNEKEQTVFLKEKGMRINLDTIAKGYATDRAKYLLQLEGVSGGVVNAFGALITWGTQPDNRPWTIDIADPNSKPGAFAGLNISNMALSTSAVNEKFSIIGGKKYMQTVNPKTGLPLRSFESVSILSPSAELAAAMAAPVKVMGVKLSLNLFNRLNQLVCVIVNDRKKVYVSKSISLMAC
jgi:thiamine biosynthesis lipoprotein